LSKQHSHELTFIAGLHRLDAANKTAWFYLMNTSRNRNRWCVTAKALEEAQTTLIGKPIGMGKDYQLGHFSDEESMNVGSFTEVDNKGNYALGKASIPDAKALAMLEAGELGPISAVIYPYYETCSKCEAVLDEGWAEHECIASNQGYAIVHSFEFARYDFVDVPAYPQAGFMNFAAHKDGTVSLALLAGVYEFSQSPKGANMSEKFDSEKFAALEQKAAKAETDLKKAQEDNTAQKEQIRELSAKLKQIEDEKHASLVEQAYKARAEAGIAGEEKAEREMLAAQVDSTLKLFIAEAQKVAKVVQGSKSRPVPELQFTAENQDSLEAAMEQQRAKMGFPARKSEKVKEEN
jgi:hypothetical protein